MKALDQARIDLNYLKLMRWFRKATNKQEREFLPKEHSPTTKKWK